MKVFSTLIVLASATAVAADGDAETKKATHFCDPVGCKKECATVDDLVGNVVGANTAFMVAASSGQIVNENGNVCVSDSNAPNGNDDKYGCNACLSCSGCDPTLTGADEFKCAWGKGVYSDTGVCKGAWAAWKLETPPPIYYQCDTLSGWYHMANGTALPAIDPAYTGTNTDAICDPACKTNACNNLMRIEQCSACKGNEYKCHPCPAPPAAAPSSSSDSFAAGGAAPSALAVLVASVIAAYAALF